MAAMLHNIFEKTIYRYERILEHEIIEERETDRDYIDLFDNRKNVDIDELSVSSYVVMSREYRDIEMIDEVLAYCIEEIDIYTDDFDNFQKMEMIAFEERGKDPKTENYVRVVILYKEDDLTL